MNERSIKITLKEYIVNTPNDDVKLSIELYSNHFLPTIKPHTIFYDNNIINDENKYNEIINIIDNNIEIIKKLNIENISSYKGGLQEVITIQLDNNNYSVIGNTDNQEMNQLYNNIKTEIINVIGIDNVNHRNDKIKGSLIGGAIGDALGYQIEFKRNIKDKEITKYQDDKGIISDDTQMCLFTANALLWRETRGSLRGIAPLPARAIYEAYLDWLDTQNNTSNHNSISWIKGIPELNITRAPGNTCLSSLASGKMGTIEEPINNSKGCGGIMRVAPVGLYAKDSITAGKVGAESSAITHGHPLGILPCYILASMLNMIVYNNETIEVALDKSVHQYYDEFNKFDKEDVDYLIELINKAKKLSKDNISDVEAISSLGEGWVAEETFAIAIYSCLKYPNSFQDAIVCSINHDGDSDSTGAVAGNIIGAYLGYDAIPDYYKDNVELKNIILELADDMSVDIPISEYSSNKDEKWENKYLYCKYIKDNNILFYKKKENDTIWWLDNPDAIGEHLFTFDKERIFNLFKDYPHALTPEQKEIFDKENPYWAEYFKDRQ